MDTNEFQKKLDHADVQALHDLIQCIENNGRFLVTVSSDAGYLTRILYRLQSLENSARKG